MGLPDDRFRVLPWPDRFSSYTTDDLPVQCCICTRNPLLGRVDAEGCNHLMQCGSALQISLLSCLVGYQCCA